MKGIVLAGGTGSRLWPITRSVSKQLLPIYDKPMIYYPISTLMLAGIRDILIITTPHEQLAFKELLGDGSSFGVNFTYKVQPKPEGLAQALIIAEDFQSQDSLLMVLGDNIFHGFDINFQLKNGLINHGAHIFVYEVSNPTDYGILYLNDQSKPIDIIEKPISPDSNLAVTGLYYFDKDCGPIARGVLPSQRGELEITSVIADYMSRGSLDFTLLPRGTAWLDTGNPNAMHDASTYVRVMEERTGIKIACLEEIAFQNAWLSEEELVISASRYKGNSYGKYLELLVSGKNH
jgi:glucose-1-phosphate thymidylyltransferase